MKTERDHWNLFNLLYLCTVSATAAAYKGEKENFLYFLVCCLQVLCFITPILWPLGEWISEHKDLARIVTEERNESNKKQHKVKRKFSNSQTTFAFTRWMMLSRYIYLIVVVLLIPFNSSDMLFQIYISSVNAAKDFWTHRVQCSYMYLWILCLLITFREAKFSLCGQFFFSFKIEFHTSSGDSFNMQNVYGQKEMKT